MTIPIEKLIDDLDIELDLSKFTESRGIYFAFKIVRNPELTDLSGCVFYRCVLDGAGFGKSEIYIDCKDAADITYKDVCEIAKLQLGNIYGLDLSYTDLRDADMQGAYLETVNLEYATLEGANLNFANLQGANLQGAKLQYANLELACLEDANLEVANLEGANLRGAVLRNTNLSNAKLHDAKLQGANLDEADLSYSNLEGADLKGANLQNVDLDGANLDGANLEGANLEGAVYSEHTRGLDDAYKSVMYCKHQNRSFIPYELDDDSYDSDSEF